MAKNPSRDQPAQPEQYRPDVEHPADDAMGLVDVEVGSAHGGEITWRFRVRLPPDVSTEELAALQRLASKLRAPTYVTLHRPAGAE